MAARFEMCHVPYTFIEPTSVECSQIEVSEVAQQYGVEPALNFRITSITLNHLKMIRRFVDDASADYGVFCEDDIHLRRSLRADLSEMVDIYKRLSLDILLLGYLVPYREAAVDAAFAVQSYDDDLWGAQMYMLSQHHARHVLETFTILHALRNPQAPFSPDWTITKHGRRARVTPLLAIEEGAITDTSHEGQVNFHRQCHQAHYDAEFYTPLIV